jgi:hypothetical protein
MISIMSQRRPSLACVLLFSSCVALVTTLCGRATYARDDGHWAERVGPEVAHWMGSLMQPDTVTNGNGISCCGEADASAALAALSNRPKIAWPAFSSGSPVSAPPFSLGANGTTACGTAGLRLLMALPPRGRLGWRQIPPPICPRVDPCG